MKWKTHRARRDAGIKNAAGSLGGNALGLDRLEAPAQRSLVLLLLSNAALAQFGENFTEEKFVSNSVPDLNSLVLGPLDEL